MRVPFTGTTAQLEANEAGATCAASRASGAPTRCPATCGAPSVGLS